MATLAGSDNALRALAFTVLLVLVAAEAKKFDPKYGRHNITMGQRQGRPPYYSDSLIIHDNPVVSASWLRVQSVDICYPRKGYDTTRMFSITAFNVTDRVPKGDGGYAFITGGGLNSGKLCLHLKTQRGNGYNFDINIWGFYIN